MSILGAVVAIWQDGCVLLTQREDFETWCLPGGMVDDGESPAEAAVREAREETGLEIRLTHFVGLYSKPRWRAGGSHLMVFAAEPVGGTLRPAPGEVLDAGYYDPRSLPEPLMWQHNDMIADSRHTTGGAVVRSLDMDWPLARDMTRQELYELRDRSGLPRVEFYRRYLYPSADVENRLEIGPVELLRRSIDRDQPST